MILQFRNYSLVALSHMSFSPKRKESARNDSSLFRYRKSPFAIRFWGSLRVKNVGRSLSKLWELFCQPDSDSGFKPKFHFGQSLKSSSFEVFKLWTNDIGQATKCDLVARSIGKHYR
mmetsp:Transcript_339/g.500  ORF Transcript_339/g.500 Transcript_339/m.500 type:complete len:117 (-) Transcript_339:98-448(-)